MDYEWMNQWEYELPIPTGKSSHHFWDRVLQTSLVMSSTASPCTAVSGHMLTSLQ